MIDPKTTDLMNRVLDGDATESERAHLDRYLAAHPEARTHYDEFSRLVQRLDSHPLADPPPVLHSHIMAAVEDHGSARSHAAAHRDDPHGRGFAAWVAGVFSPPRLRVATTFGLGLATGAFLLAALHFGRSGAWDASRVDPSQLTGTITKPERPDLTSARGPIRVGAIAPAKPTQGLGCSADVWQEGSETVVEVWIRASEPIAWSLRYDADRWVPTGFEDRTGLPAEFTVATGEVGGGHSGDHRYRIAFLPLEGAAARDGGAQSFVLKVVQAGQVLFEEPTEPVTQ
jgi:hypothetical protein